MSDTADVFKNCIIVQPDWLEFEYATSSGNNLIRIKRDKIVVVYQSNDKSESMIYTEGNIFIVKMPYEEVVKLV